MKRWSPLRQISQFVAWHNCGQRLWCLYLYGDLRWTASPMGAVKTCPKCGQPLPDSVGVGWSNDLLFGEPKSDVS